MALDLPRRHPPGVHRQDLVIESAETTLMTRYDLRLEGPVAVPRNLDHGLPEIALQRLRACSIARVATALASRVALLIPQVVGQLGVHRTLHQSLRQLFQ